MAEVFEASQQIKKMPSTFDSPNESVLHNALQAKIAEAMLKKISNEALKQKKISKKEEK